MLTELQRKQIKDAKPGFHWIAWAPGQEPMACQFERITSGKYVWVSLTDGGSARLNETASQLLLEGKYRR